MFMSIKSNARAIEQKLYPVGKGRVITSKPLHDLRNNFTQREKGLSKSEKWLNCLG
jgi:hypothetical protein